MGYLLSTFWFWLLLAAILGLAVGFMSCDPRNPRGWRTFFPLGLALAGGGLVALLQLLPQRLGYWLELSLLMLAAYGVGCCVACLVRRTLAPAETSAEPLAQTMVPAAKSSAASSRGGAKPAAALGKPSSVAAGELAVEPAKPGHEPASAEAIEQAITGLSAARGGAGDDLTRIYGIDKEIQKKLNNLGLFHYDQIASLTPGNRRWLFRQLGHEGRFPSWWWRWRYDAERLVAGKSPVSGASLLTGNAVAFAGTDAPIAAKKPKPKAVAPKPEAKPVSAALPSEDGFEGVKPAVLTSPRGGKGDDLKRIAGIGKQNEGRLHGLGVWHFDQIAAWSAEEVKWVGGYLAFPGRIEREDWIAQAKVLASGEATEFSKRADAGKVATSRDASGDDGQGNVIPLTPKPGPTKS